MTDIQTQIMTLQNQLKAAEAEKAAVDAAVRAKKAFETKSRIATVQYLEKFLDFQIFQGKLTSDQFYDIFRKYRNVYLDLDDQYSFFLSTVIKLISHPYHGVECSTSFIGNGGLKYMGKSYETKEALYEAVVRNLIGEYGDDPFGTDVWFYELLQVHLEDTTAFPAYVAVNEVKTRILPLMKRVANQNKPLELPDESELTESDMLFLYSLTGL